MSWYFLGGFSAYWIVPSGSMAKPLRVRADLGMIGRHLEGDVERDLEALARGRRDEGPHVGDRAELGMDVGVAALVRPDRPRTARRIRAGVGHVVRALAERAADGMDRRQVQHVEAHAGDVRQAGDHVAQRAVATRIGRGGAREQLVPGREPGPLAVHHDAQRGFHRRREPPVRVPARGLARDRVQSDFACP